MFVPTHLSASEAPVVQVKEPPHIDARATALEAFFSHYNCPAINDQLIPTYLNAADQNNLDYRLLPSISVVESSCLKHYRLNNPFGWNSDRTGFSSIQSGIYYVEGQLADGRHYAGKTIDQKLHAYNPNPSYAVKVTGFMKEIDNE